MRIAAISMMKDEADIVERSVLSMLEQVDEVTVIDNASTDGTRDLLAGLPIMVIDDPEVAYYQSRRMTELAHRLGEQGADWVIPFDADELWSPSHWEGFDNLRAVLGDKAGDEVVCGAMFDHVATSHDEEDEPDPVARIRWRRTKPIRLPKIAVRPAPDLVIGQGNHVAHAGARRIRAREGYFPIMVRHFSNRSPEQFIRKIRNGAAAYAASDLPESMGGHWREFGKLTDDQLCDHFCAELWVDDPENDPTLVFDPVA